MQPDPAIDLALFATLDMLVLVESGEQGFRCAAALPDWARRLLPELDPSAGTGERDATMSNRAGSGSDTRESDQFIDIADALPFVAFFLEDARTHWHNNSAGSLISGEFVEESSSGETFALQLRATVHHNRNVLILEHLGDRFDRSVAAYQAARETLLTRDHMEIEIRRITAQIREREEEISMRLLSVTGIRDVETGEHVRRIGLYSEAIARALCWDAQQTIDIRIAAPMHDIGKVGIPDRILLKPGRLTPAELEIMRTHAELGAEMLAGSTIPLLDMAREIALFHHERWDGDGYPHGLRKLNIPESARIVSICDVYDALINKRVYKRAFSNAEALDIMLEQREKHFDPELLDCFVDILPEIQSIRKSLTDTGPETDLKKIGNRTGTLG